MAIFWTAAYFTIHIIKMAKMVFVGFLCAAQHKFGAAVPGAPPRPGFRKTRVFFKKSPTQVGFLGFIGFWVLMGFFRTSSAE